MLIRGTLVILLILRFITVFSSPKSNLEDVINNELKVTSSIEIKFDDFRNREYQMLWFEYNTLRVGVKIERWPELELGDRVVITKINRSFLAAENNLLFFERQIWLIDEAEYDVKKGSYVWKKLNEIRDKYKQVFRQVLPYTHSGLLGAMVIGDKSGMSQTLKDQLKWAGVSHIVVVSGFNIMIVYAYFYKLLLLFVDKHKSTLGSLFLMWLYISVVGYEPPVVRAGIFLSIIGIGNIYGRVVNIKRVFLLTLLIMLTIEPRLIMNLSWQLSAGATAGLIWIEPWLLRSFRGFMTYKSKLMETILQSFTTTAAAMVAVWPLLVLYFESISIVTILTNILILWLVPIVTVWGLISGLVGTLFESVANLLVLLLYIPLSYFKFVLEVFGRESMMWELGRSAKITSLVAWLIILINVVAQLKKHNEE